MGSGAVLVAASAHHLRVVASVLLRCEYGTYGTSAAGRAVEKRCRLMKSPCAS